MLNIARGQKVKIFKIEDNGSYSTVKMSSVRHDKRSDDWKYSNWSFVRFVGRAHDRLSEVREGDRIVLDGAGISLEEYKDRDGNRAWPKNPQFVVFNFKLMDEDDGGGYSEPEVEEDGDDFPF